MEVDMVNALAQLSTMSKKLELLKTSAVGAQISCGLCGGPHENRHCSLVQDDQFTDAQVNYVGNQPRPLYNDPHSNTYDATIFTIRGTPTSASDQIVPLKSGYHSHEEKGLNQYS
ncbi:hypothetical protein PIB30_087658 [Stylosanthes scabra]|uniref:Uncharacterized protein n=1 Tax=Stylosanthes scabra TaxID=79078 RepID=A0ABU6ZS71_9FABA|nr:hypothetical protein [Stylosanthes scabra]